MSDKGRFLRLGNVDVHVFCICLQFRFCFCAVATLSLLGRLDAVDTDLTAKFVQSCQNFDGGFGSRVGAESHAGLIYTCLGTLAITGHLHTCDHGQKCTCARATSISRENWIIYDSHMSECTYMIVIYVFWIIYVQIICLQKTHI